MTNEQLNKEAERFIKQETRRRYTKFWGQKQIIEPQLVSEIFGDGKQIIHVTPIDTRPNYYVVRIDSKTNLDDHDFYTEFIENILTSIEEEFGCVDDYKYEINKAGHHVVRSHFPEKGERWKSYYKVTKWPMLHWSGGNWGTLKNFGATKTNLNQ